MIISIKNQHQHLTSKQLLMKKCNVWFHCTYCFKMFVAHLSPLEAWTNQVSNSNGSSRSPASSVKPSNPKPWLRWHKIAKLQPRDHCLLVVLGCQMQILFARSGVQKVFELWSTWSKERASEFVFHVYCLCCVCVKEWEVKVRIQIWNFVTKLFPEDLPHRSRDTNTGEHRLCQWSLSCYPGSSKIL